DRLRRLNGELALLYDVASVASESLELETILEKCLARVLKTLPADAGLIHLQEADGSILALAAQHGIRRTTLERTREATPGQGLIGSIFQTGQSLAIDDVRRDSRASSVARNSGMRGYAGVPMRAKGRVLGVFSVLGRVPHAWQEEDMALLSSVGDQIGLTIDHARLQGQASRVAVLEERSRLARELHDAVSQSLYSLTLFAEAGRRHLAQGELQLAQERLERLAETSQETFREMRLLVHELRPHDLEVGGLRGALEHRLETVERRTGVEVDLDIDPDLCLPSKLEEALYRIAQEALNNAQRHARAGKVVVSVEARREEVRLEVRDDGVGFDPGRAGRHGLGLLSIRERVDQIGGTLRVDSQPGKGTTVAVNVELPTDG
ncbi:MAG: GAF domain-containing sensor histidine kinase, partial [Acidobacteriota bacterium]